ncbi:hypothetical protein [Pseudoalteromonas atlantica]|jgi:hypothetical protein|uniref:hypothetical protein n=1 Tax=Pseudoalteromonas atlantica TaxID=288 RepID=UPI001E4E6754|nr:hypothetical protein [Pseudoalteromonas atlantica]
MKAIILFLFLVFQFASLPVSAQPDSKITNVLFINSTNQHMPWHKSVEEGLNSELSTRTLTMSFLLKTLM